MAYIVSSDASNCHRDKTSGWVRGGIVLISVAKLTGESPAWVPSKAKKKKKKKI